MLVEELYTELLKKLEERERFSIYVRMGTLMERYRETRDETLIEEFKKRFKHILIVKGLWEDDKEEGNDDHSMTDSSSETINNSYKNSYNNSYKNGYKNSYSRLNHFKDCIRSYQGKNKFRMKEEDIKHIEDYFRENYSLDMITRPEIERVCKMLGKKFAKGNENALFRWLNPKVLDDIVI